MIGVGKFLHLCSVYPLSAREKLIRAYIGVNVLGDSKKQLILKVISAPRQRCPFSGLKDMAFATCGQVEDSSILDVEKCK